MLTTLLIMPIPVMFIIMTIELENLDMQVVAFTLFCFWWLAKYVTFSAIDVQLSYIRDDTYVIVIGDKSYHVYAMLDTVADKNILRSVVDGVHSKASVVLNRDTLHLFTLVRRSVVTWLSLQILCCVLFK